MKRGEGSANGGSFWTNNLMRGRKKKKKPVSRLLHLTAAAAAFCAFFSRGIHSNADILETQRTLEARAVSYPTSKAPRERPYPIKRIDGEK